MGDFREGSGPVDLASAADIDTVARALLHEILALDGVHRAGIAVVEGGGRRLRFLPATRTACAAEWCHIDAYDDVPLTHVVRTGQAILGGLDNIDHRYAELITAQREAGTRALAALPFPGVAGPIGGAIIYFDRPQAFDDRQCEELAALGRRAGEAVRRVRFRGASAPGTTLAAESERVATLRTDDDARSAGVARCFLRETLAAWRVGEDPTETAALCLSELVTNATIHAGGTVEVTVSLDDGLLTVSVRDHGGTGAGAAVVVDDDPMRVFGRGLVLVDALSSRWGAEHDEVGTTAWFVLEL